MADITQIGRQHLAEHGAAGLSLRAVARDLGVVSSAVYRYVGSRDELLTLLVIDAYTDLADAVNRAVRGEDPTQPARWLRVFGRAIREWALAEPSRYGLIFGSPVPGYAAPALTIEPGTRVVRLLAEMFESAARSGALTADPVDLPPELGADLDGIRAEMGLSAPDGVVLSCLTVWPAIFGAVNFEVFGQYGPTFAKPEQLFERQLDTLIAAMHVTMHVTDPDESSGAGR